MSLNTKTVITLEQRVENWKKAKQVVMGSNFGNASSNFLNRTEDLITDLYDAAYVSLEEIFNEKA